MCELYSWIEKEGKVVFLTAEDVFDTKRGKALQKHTNSRDWYGHGAIRWYYNFKGGRERECTDFSTPKNFPPELAESIKDGKMWRFGISDKMIKMLLSPARAEHVKVCDKAWAERDKVRDKAWAEYVKVRDKAWAEYVKVCDKAWAERDKVRDKAWAERDKVRDKAWAEYVKVCDKAWAERDKVRDKAWAEYIKVRDKARAEYVKVCDKARAELWLNPKNRRKVWR